jgi:hypothetical protein
MLRNLLSAAVEAAHNNAQGLSAGHQHPQFQLAIR